MRKPIFLVGYNRPTNRIASKILVVADVEVNREFISVLCERLGTNADLLFIDTSRKTQTNVILRHVSYLILAKKTLFKQHKYDTIIFWQQFIGLYWSLFSYIKRGRKKKTYLFPLIFKRRRGITGKITKLFFQFSIFNPALKGAICHSAHELNSYRKNFPESEKKIFFVPYGLSLKINEEDTINQDNHPYFFSGGTSNRDYLTLLSVAKKIKSDFIIACRPKDISGMNVPNNVKILFSAYEEEFESLIRASLAVVLILENTDISSGQIVVLKAMAMGKPVIMTRAACIMDYLDETCAFLVEPKEVKEIQEVLEFVINYPEEAQKLAMKAKKRYQEKFKIQNFASFLAELILEKN